MKTRLFLIFPFLCGALVAGAQFARTSGPPPGPGLSGSTAKLFGENSGFSAALEVQTGSEGSPDSMTFPGKIFFDEGKSRFEMDMSQLKGAQMPPQAAAQMKAMGMDKVVAISRPDKKVGYQIYPGMQAYVENPLPEQEAATRPTDFKIETTELGNETIDGHACVKNKAAVTDKEGVKHESTVWNAKDLKKFPIKIESLDNGMKVTMLFHDVNLVKPAAALFDPPADAAKYDSMQSLMQQVMMKRLGGAPGGPPARNP